MLPIRELYIAGLLAYTVGIFGGLAGHLLKKAGPWLVNLLCGFSIAGALLESAASLSALLAGTENTWSLPSGVPYLSYTVRLDPLSAYFGLVLSLLAVWSCSSRPASGG